MANDAVDTNRPLSAEETAGYEQTLCPGEDQRDCGKPTVATDGDLLGRLRHLGRASGIATGTFVSTAVLNEAATMIERLLPIKQRADRAMEVGSAHSGDFYRGIQLAADFILNNADDDNEFGEQP